MGVVRCQPSQWAPPSRPCNFFVPAMCVTVTCRGWFLKSTTLSSSSSFQKSRSFDVARLTLFQSHEGSPTQICIWCRPTQVPRIGESVDPQPKHGCIPVQHSRPGHSPASLPSCKRVWAWNFFGLPRAVVEEMRRKFLTLGCPLSTHQNLHTRNPNFNQGGTESWSSVTSSDFMGSSPSNALKRPRNVMSSSRSPFQLRDLKPD